MAFASQEEEGSNGLLELVYLYIQTRPLLHFSILDPPASPDALLFLFLF